MSEAPVLVKDRSRGLVKIGATLGLVGGGVATFFITYWRGAQAEPDSSMLEGVSWAIALFSPFLLALSALPLPASRRVGIWLGTGIAALMVAWMTFYFSILFVPGAALLIAAAATSHSGWEHRGKVFAWATLPVAAALIGFLAISQLTAPRCWERRNNGPWVEVPAAAGESGMSASAGTTVRVSPEGQERSFEERCTGNAPTLASTGVPLLAWVGTGLVVHLARPRREEVARP